MTPGYNFRARPDQLRLVGVHFAAAPDIDLLSERDEMLNSDRRRRFRSADVRTPECRQRRTTLLRTTETATGRGRNPVGLQTRAAAYITLHQTASVSIRAILTSRRSAVACKSLVKGIDAAVLSL